MSTESFTKETVKMHGQGKTTLPKQARRYLEVKKGDKIHFKITKDGEVTVEKADDL